MIPNVSLFVTLSMSKGLFAGQTRFLDKLGMTALKNGDSRFMMQVVSVRQERLKVPLVRAALPAERRQLSQQRLPRRRLSWRPSLRLPL